jgi:hypothetical protein
MTDPVSIVFDTYSVKGKSGQYPLLEHSLYSDIE